MACSLFGLARFLDAQSLPKHLLLLLRAIFENAKQVDGAIIPQKILALDRSAIRAKERDHVHQLSCLLLELQSRYEMLRGGILLFAIFLRRLPPLHATAEFRQYH